MNYKSSLLFILFSIILINAGGFLLRYFEYSTYFIFLGFRFHISLFLPLILILRNEQRFLIKQTFINPEYRGKFIPLIWIVIPFIVICILPFMTDLIKEGDPEYFYEFGLSSLFDFPIYLVWNFPQLVFFYLFLNLASSGRKNKFLFTLFITFFLFAFEFLPVKLTADPELDYSGLAALFLSAFISSILITLYENVYWYSVSIFTIFWAYFLAFGSKSPLIINILFAAKYRTWEGFLVTGKEIAPYLILFYLLLVIIAIFITLPLRRNRQSKLNFSETKNISQIPGIS